MSSSITADHQSAFEALTSGRTENFVLFSCYVNGTPASAIVAINRAGDERETAVASGDVPIWGQTGTFIIEHDGMHVRIELNVIFGIGSSVGFWPGFAAHAVEFEKPFLSETGYRSFLGIHADSVPGLSPDEFASRVIAGYVERDLKGKLKNIEARCHERAA